MEFCAKLNKIMETLDIPEGMIFDCPAKRSGNTLLVLAVNRLFSLVRMQNR